MRILKYNFGLRLVFALFVIIIMTQLIKWINTKIFDMIKISSKQGLDEPKDAARSSPNRYEDVEILLKDLLVQDNGKGCNMPNVDPFSAEYTRLYKDVQPVNCDSEDWVECNFSQCYVKKPILDRMKDLSCIYRDIIYVNDDKYYIGDAVKVYSDAKYTLNVSDYVRISCSGVEANSSSRLRTGWQGRKAGFRPLPGMLKHSNSLNVFLLIIDSVSRNAFMRRMPISYGILKNELLAVVMNSYNIVDQGTAGALWPILTGHNELEVSDSRRRPENTERVDPKPFLFTLLNEYGYRTAFLEDMPWTGTFNSFYNGFESMPADHYLRHLVKDIGLCNKPEWSTSEQCCFGSESNFKFIVEYSAKLFEMNSKKFCVSVTASYSHEDVNMLTLVDEDFARFLRKFKRDGYLVDTVLFVMGDHGPRVSSLRNSYVGRIEEHLPFLSIVLPERLKTARPDALPNLLANSKVLTTPFDVHTTILDTLGLKKHRNKYKVPGANLERGISFLEPIAGSRGCAEAGIVPHFCICTKTRQNVPAEDVVYTKVARKLAKFVNTVTSKERQKCAKRKLLSIEWVLHLDHIIDLSKNSKTIFDENFYTDYEHRHREIYQNYYLAKIIMDPGEAIFEGTVIYNINKDTFSVTDRYVSRVDKYGNEPNCVKYTHPHLSKYCYCI